MPPVQLVPLGKLIMQGLATCWQLYHTTLSRIYVCTRGTCLRTQLPAVCHWRALLHSVVLGDSLDFGQAIRQRGQDQII